MAVLTNILPITILGSLCFIILIVLSYYSWKRAASRRADTQLDNPEYEVEEIPGTTDFVMVGRRGDTKKKVKKPKLWEVWVSALAGRPTHERKMSSGSSFSDLSLDKDIGYWAELKVRIPASISPRMQSSYFNLSAHDCNLCQKPEQNSHTAPSYVH
jgi:hypothetical protein